MTLPFSDKPEKSSVYNDLKTKTLSQITDADFDALETRMFAEGVNGLEDENVGEMVDEYGTRWNPIVRQYDTNW